MYRTKAPPNKYYCQTVSLCAYDLNIIILTMRIFGIAPTAGGHRQRQRHVYHMRWCHIHLTIICVLIHLSKNFQCTYNLHPLPLKRLANRLVTCQHRESGLHRKADIMHSMNSMAMPKITRYFRLLNFQFGADHYDATWTSMLGYFVENVNESILIN